MPHVSTNEKPQEKNNKSFDNKNSLPQQAIFTPY
jgi:hypothetical protein